MPPFGYCRCFIFLQVVADAGDGAVHVEVGHRSAFWHPDPGSTASDVHKFS